jgi:hypothetical protein
MTARTMLQAALAPLVFLMASCADGTTDRAPSSAVPADNPGSVAIKPVRNAARLVISQLEVGSDDSIAVAFHPDDSPAWLSSAGVPAEACPAGIDAHTGSRSPWPAGSFDRCVPIGAAGHELPTTDGMAHVAFSVRSTSPSPLRELVVKYSRADAFLQVMPPMDEEVDLEATFTPATSTVAAHAFLVPSYEPATRSRIEVRQGTRLLATEASCDFPSEVPCLGGATRNAEVNVRIRHSPDAGKQLALFLSWG